MAATASTLDEVRTAMSKTNDLFNREVFGRRNFNALDDVYTADARILPPGAPLISGRDAIKNFWSNMIVSANAKAAVLESLDIIPAGDDIVEIGRATLTIQPDGQTATKLEAKYVVHWKQEDGRWKWNVDIWNTNS